MMLNELALEDLKKKLYRLHFLLTEKESRETTLQSRDQFKSCYRDALSGLSGFITSEYNVQPQTDSEIVELAFTYKLVNQEMVEQLRMMVTDFDKIQSIGISDKIYNNIKENYAGHLQKIYDMLARMGQDAEEE